MSKNIVVLDAGAITKIVLYPGGHCVHVFAENTVTEESTNVKKEYEVLFDWSFEFEQLLARWMKR